MDQTSHNDVTPPSQLSRFLMPLLFVGAIWMVVFIGFDVYQSLNTIPLSYTDFKEQIVQGNVKKVFMKGDQVRGELLEPISSAQGTMQTSRSFSTTLPPISDQNLISLLETHHVPIDAESSESSWWEMFLIAWLPWIIIFGLIFYANKKMQDRVGGMGGNLFGMGQSRAKRYQKTMNDVHFTDVAGLENPKQDLQEVIDYLKNPSKFRELGAELPKGVLLLGPPGTGKTLLARACAGGSRCPIFYP